MRLVVTEKPSVARDLARVLGVQGRSEGFLEGNGLRITWCVGHLVELCDPAHYDEAWKAWRLDRLPMVPERFALQGRGEGADQLAVVRKLLRERGVDEVINACDAGREGELIFRYVYEFAGCKLPVQRLWVSSLTDEAIRTGWRQLQPGARYDALGDAARCRSEADWLVGLNATRALTCRSRDAGGDTLWSVGRVQTPTLAMIVRRDAQIEAFVPEPYWTVKATFAAAELPGRPTWMATWFRDERETASKGEDRPEVDAKPEDEAPKAERLGSADDAARIVAAAEGQTGRVLRSRRTEKREKPPLLYDLTSLQRRANQRYGLSAAATLEVAQALYERHKLITYPRTDARHLTHDQAAGLPDVIRGVGAVPVYRPFCEALLAEPLRLGPRVIDDAEVGDHHAILPTGRSAAVIGLSADEKRVYDLVVRRLLAALSPDAIFDMAEIVVAVDPAGPVDVPTPLTFRARGRVCRQEGWRAVDPPGASRDLELPPVRDGDAAAVEDVEALEGQTRPPRPYDDASLLLSMETAGKELDDAELKRAMRHAGLGTPATRAAILQTLLQREYVVREGRALRSTAIGRALISMLPVEELKSAELTGRWEHRLSRMAEGREARGPFMADVVAHLHELIGRIVAAPLAAEASVKRRPEEPKLGACPVCGEAVRARGPVFACDTGRACTFVVFAKIAGKAVTASMVKEVLKGGVTRVYKGFRSKAGKEFEAALTWKDGRVAFVFAEREAAGPTAAGRGEGGARGEPSPPARASKAAPKGAASDAKAAPRRSPAARRAAEAAPPVMPPPSTPEGLGCPRCGRGRILAGRSAWGCDRWREGCDWRLTFDDERGRPRDPAAVAAALR